MKFEILSGDELIRQDTLFKKQQADFDNSRKTDQSITAKLSRNTLLNLRDQILSELAMLEQGLRPQYAVLTA